MQTDQQPTYALCKTPPKINAKQLQSVQKQQSMWNKVNCKQTVKLCRRWAIMKKLKCKAQQHNPALPLVDNEFVTRCLHFLQSLAESIAVLIVSSRSAMSSLMLSIHLSGCLPTFRVLLYGRAFLLAAVVFRPFL